MRTLKKLLFGLALVGLSATLFSACSEDDDDDPTPGNNGGNGSGTFTAQVDGAGYTGAYFQITNNGSGVVTIAAAANANGTGNQIQLNMTNATAVGSYQFTFTSGNVGLFNDVDNLDVNDPTATSFSTLTNPAAATGSVGSVTFTELTDSKLVGTFTFEGANPSGTTVSVTQGQFDLTY